jgi:hypothetical protein
VDICALRFLVTLAHFSSVNVVPQLTQSICIIRITLFQYGSSCNVTAVLVDVQLLDVQLLDVLSKFVIVAVHPMLFLTSHAHRFVRLQLDAATTCCTA